MDKQLISNSEQLLRTLIEQLKTDVLFECFAGLLVESGTVEANNIHVLPKENYRRSYKNDIVLAKNKEAYEKEGYFEETESDYLTLYTSRSATLDYLPEDFYNTPDNTGELWNKETGERRSEAERKAYKEKIKAQLDAAHRFFKPVEVEYNKVRIARELQEVRQLENFDSILEAFWGRFKIINDKWKRFVRTLHLVPFILGDKTKTKALIEYVLDTEIELEFSVEQTCELSPAQRKALLGEEAIMGFNMLLGSTFYHYLEICTLRIKGINTATFFEYFKEGTSDQKLINEILNHYFPLNIEVRLDFEIEQPDEEEDTVREVPIIGYSSVLGA